MLLTTELLLNYQRCHRRAFLDAYGDLNQRDAPSDYLLKILQDSQANHREVLSLRSHQKPNYTHQDWETGASATLDLMRQGVDRIYQGVLRVEQPDGVVLLANPDLLIRQPGQSNFGDWLYLPAEIKLSKRPKLEYQIVAAFHTQVLATVQGAWPEETWLMLREKGMYQVDLWEMLPRMQTILDDCIQTLRQSQEPEVFISRNRCHLCHWFSHCYATAKAEQHLSLLPGVTPTRYTHLQSLNLTSLESLANTPPAHLEPLPGFGREAAHKLVRQARSTLLNRAMLGGSYLGSESPTQDCSSRISERLEPFLSPEELPTAPVELYFDIEAEPSLNLVYLHGVLVVDRVAQTETFHPLLADRPEGEAAIWEDLLELLWRYPDAPIFHFCPYEVQTVQRLAQVYKAPVDQIEPLIPRFVDLHERITRTVTLPVESYALKPIARWLGFDWRDPNANGAQSIYWYAQWLTTGDRSFLNAIVEYNEDDCRATYHIKNWLVEFLQEVYQVEMA